MKTIKVFTIIFSLAVLFTACQDVIDIDLDSIEPKLVIDGVITDSVVVKISKSTDYFEPGIYPPVSNAIVTVTDNSGNLFQLEEISPGIYSENHMGVEGNGYTLDVEINNEIYTGSVEMPHKVTIDSISIEPTPDYMEFSGGYIVNCHLQDSADVENYYRLKVSKLNETDPENVLCVFDDAFVDGNEISMQWDNNQFFEQDTVVVELQTLAKSTYEYYRTLSSIFESGMIGNANPANPITNLSNGALGYFGAYTVSRDTIIILP
ncbi:DUF4249 domain-containing protein [Maribellus maritimus]|uniref:DUF4249 domain-containing protein n=1 Tax=Maribellus maritimus TaxID=2870838 RepID=UPI001EEC4EE0|nr:DUF4249 domain-containing protein [Maribellus maritimus]MCG6186922.1 DUF4249 domain-containing protein [Maribellus maritimus]